MSFKVASKIKSFGGLIYKIEHESAVLGGLTSKLNLFVPGGGGEGGLVPVLYYLGGLTCTGDNGLEKGNILGSASSHGIAVVFPDTSPRGAGAPGEDDGYDFGTGAGFYVDATTEGFAKHYNMETYVTEELPKLLNDRFKLDPERTSIFGHSMGGHGALTLYLRHRDLYRSVSAFAPICNPMQCPWGQKALKGYFGESSKETWGDHDAVELIRKGVNEKSEVHGLVDSGTGDDFYKQGQLLPENLIEAIKEQGLESQIQVRLQDDYDHSYPSIIASFAPEHVAFHAKYLT
ncbi:hypothetical protein PYCC9005_003920 [Savitreella phatthalungensis]